MKEKRLIPFDWAIKRILRSKTNFAVLEGFLTSLLGEPIKILSVLESESNKENVDDKFNRTDLKIENSKHEIIIVEIQNDSQKSFLMRMLYSTSKTICDHLSEGDSYDKVSKVISVNILYFSLGYGDDYVYRGYTDFRGIHTASRLELTKSQVKTLKKSYPGDLMPEYYVINVTGFDDVAKTPLDEWIYFLKNEAIKENFAAPGLKEANAALDMLKLTQPEREEFNRYLDYRRRARDSIETAIEEGIERGLAEGIERGLAEGIERGRAEGIERGRAEGIERGRAEGIERGRAEGIERGRAEGIERGRVEGIAKGIENMAKKMKEEGLPTETISKLSGLSKEDVLKL